MTKLLLIFIYSFFALGQVGRIHLFVQPIFVYLYEFFVVVLLGYILIKNLYIKSLKIKVFLPLIVFAIYMFLSLLLSLPRYSIYENSIGLLYVLRYGVYIFFFTLFFSFQDNNVKFLIKMTLPLCVWILFSSIAQLFLYPNIGNIAYIGWDPHINRVVGVFLEPPITAGLVFVSGVFLANYFSSKSKFSSILVCILTLVVILLTYSRGAYIALYFSILVFCIFKKKYFLLIFITVISIVGILIAPNARSESVNLLRTTSIEARLLDYQRGMEIWRKSPIFGIGYNHIRFEKSKYINEVFLEKYNPSNGISAFHSSFLTILVSGGIIGLHLFLYLLYSLAKQNKIICICICFLSFQSLFDNVILHPFIVLFLGFIILIFHHSSRSNFT